MLCGQSFGHSESHLDCTGPIAHTCLHVAIHTEPEPAAAQLDSRAKTDSAFLRIGKGGAIDLVVCQLLQPITVEPKSDVFERLVRHRIVSVEGLACLHVLDAETYEGLAIDGVPPLVDTNADLYFAARFISKRIIGINDNEVITDVHRASITVLACRHAKIDNQTLDKDCLPDFSRLPLKSRTDRQIANTPDPRIGTFELNIDIDERDQSLASQPCTKEALVAHERNMTGRAVDGNTV